MADPDAVGTTVRSETVAVVKEAVEALVLMISPFTPHMAEELWERLGHGGGLAAASGRWRSNYASCSEVSRSFGVLDPEMPWR